jgi:hypothetical protein
VHSCLLDNDDDEMMVRDCVCQVDKDFKMWKCKAVSNVKPDSGVDILE